MTAIENLISVAKRAIKELELNRLFFTSKQLSEAIESAERSPWTRCADGLPKKRGDYIVCVQNYDHSRDTVWDHYDPSRLAFQRYENVIAWMPFPEPLKE